MDQYKHVGLVESLIFDLWARQSVLTSRQIQVMLEIVLDAVATLILLLVFGDDALGKIEHGLRGEELLLRVRQLCALR